MVNGKYIKTFAIGLCMAALLTAPLTGVAYAKSEQGSLPAFEGTISTEQTILREMQGEIDQYLFVDKVIEIDKMGFKVIYTGVADKYVEVGISPYTEENAEFIYDVFGKGQVKVVAGEELALYAPDEVVVEDILVDSDNTSSPIMDMGDNISANDAPISDADLETEQQLIDEREESSSGVDGVEAIEDVPEYRQTGIVEDLPITDTDAVEDSDGDMDDVTYVTIQDDTVRIVSENAENDISSEENSKVTPVYIAIIAGGVIVLGGAAFALSRKKAVK